MTRPAGSRALPETVVAPEHRGSAGACLAAGRVSSIWPDTSKGYPAAPTGPPSQHLDGTPFTDYSQPTACPWCARVYPGGSDWGRTRWCCGGRMRTMGPAELPVRGAAWAARGYLQAAAQYRKAARALAAAEAAS